MSRQLNLFGKPVPRRKPVYVSPKTKYEEFVNAFVLCNATLSLSDAKRQADDAWRATGKGKDCGEVEKILSAASSLADDDEKLSGKSFVVSGVSRNEAPTPTISLSVAKATEAACRMKKSEALFAVWPSAPHESQNIAMYHHT